MVRPATEEDAWAEQQEAEIYAENAWLRHAEGLGSLDPEYEHEREMEDHDPFLQYLAARGRGEVE